MESSISVSWAWAIGLISFAFGIIGGALVALFMSGGRRRAEELETKLAEQQQAFDGYRQEVSAHFLQTSELVQKMTDSYRDVYEHLARGSQSLCQEPVTTPRLDIPANPMLGERGESPKSDAEPPGAESFSDAETDPLSEDADAFLGDAPHVPELDTEASATPRTPSA